MDDIRWPPFTIEENSKLMRSYRVRLPPLPPYRPSNSLPHTPPLPVEVFAAILSLLPRTSLAALALLSRDFSLKHRLYCHCTATSTMPRQTNIVILRPPIFHATSRHPYAYSTSLPAYRIQPTVPASAATYSDTESGHVHAYGHHPLL
ncbi:hypothetical protein ARMGADRAFT_1092272 [Armillaria gallica]|uniref:F-box domain-containing protein n=1 Tax=Armillaria gallica TaxID=47427 RepID=A0A2H3CW99_ARMGA|nr:hypothetical protein ARMGADRAFT_1092272 [Armillaria gallica]